MVKSCLPARPPPEAEHWTCFFDGLLTYIGKDGLMNRKCTLDVYPGKGLGRLGRVFMLLPLLVFSSTLVAAQTNFVFNPRSGQSYNSIQEAVDHAAAWDTVLVYPGQYAESLRLTRALVLQGVRQND